MIVLIEESQGIFNTITGPPQLLNIVSYEP